MKTKLGVGSSFLAAAALLCGCSSTVTNYGVDDHFSALEATSGSTSTPEQCARTMDAVWVTGPSFQECIRYYPSQEFRKGIVRRVIVYMEGDFLSTSGAYPTYTDLTPGKRIARAEREQNRGGTPYLILGRPGTEGSSGSQHKRRTQYEILVVNAALDAIKSKYGIAEYGLVGQSGAQELGASIGGFHPLQMFADPDVALSGLPGCTVGIEAEEALRRKLEALARSIGCVPMTLPAGIRPLYHASAYYVGPFLIALLKEGAKLWAHFGASERQAMDALMPLLRGTTAAVQHAGLANGMGGCVARGDRGTIQKHLASLDETDSAAADLYRQLALRNIPLALERGTISAVQGQQIEELLKRARNPVL